MRERKEIQILLQEAMTWHLKPHMEGEGAKYEGIYRDVWHGETLVSEAIEFEQAQKLIDYLNALV